MSTVEGNETKKTPGGDIHTKNIEGEKPQTMSVDDKQPNQSVMLTASTSVAAAPAPIHSQDAKTDDSKPVVFSIGPTPLPASCTGTAHTNAGSNKDDVHVQAAKPLKITSFDMFPTNADIPKEMMTPPFSAPPTPARKPTPTVGKQFSTPQLGGAKDIIPESLNTSQHAYSKFSDIDPKGEFQSQMSYVDLPSYTYQEDMMQRQQERYKMIEEQNKTKPLQFKQTYSDPYSFKSSTDRVQARQRRGQG